MNANIKSPLDDIALYITNVGLAARRASRDIGRASTEQKNKALLAIAELITNHADKLKQANALDLEAGRVKGLDAALLDRL